MLKHYRKRYNKGAYPYYESQYLYISIFQNNMKNKSKILNNHYDKDV